jgi:hypothetical protein
MFELDWQTKGIVVEPSVDDLMAARRLADDILNRTTDEEIRIKARRIRKLIDCSLDKISTLSQLSHAQWAHSKDHSYVEARSVRVWQL